MGFADEGRETMDGRRGPREKSGMVEATALCGSGREAEEDWAEGRVRDSFFIFLRERALFGGLTGE